MSDFRYLRPDSVAAALTALGESGSVAIGGGTDLLVTIDEGLVSPSVVVDVRALPGLREISVASDGSARIGGGVRIAEIAGDGAIQRDFPVFAAAAAAVGTPALRNMGTIAGNLVQRPRCWYLRRGVACFKNGGSGCPAANGEHRYHGILAEGACRAVHPSDPAVALLALDAEVEVVGAAGSRRLAVTELYRGAADSPTRETTLTTGELIVAVHLPAAAAGGVQHWEKLMQRGAWDFALVSCAAARRRDGTVRMALGGVGLGPWRVPLSIEEDVASGGLDDESLDPLAARALYDAQPLPGTAYKVTMAQALLRRAMRGLTSGS